MRQYADLLRRNRDIRVIWFAEVISLIGDWFSQVVLAAIVAAGSPGREGVAVSSLILARFVPPLILSPLAGVLLDRFNRQTLLVWSNLLRAGLGVMYLLAISSPDLLWLIYVGIILQAIIGTVYMPGQSALVAGVVAPEDLVTANTLSSATWSAALAAGGALGGFVAAAFGPLTALIIDAATFLVAGLLLLQVRGYVYTPRRPALENAEMAASSQPTAAGIESAAHKIVTAQSPAPAGDDRHNATIRDGLRYVWNHKPTFFTLFVKFGGSLGNVDAIMIILATQVFIIGRGGELSLGIAYSAFGIGAIFGPMLTNALSDGSGKSLRRWIIIGFIGQALGWFIIGWASLLVVVCVGLITRGMAGSVNWTYSSVLLQRTTPDQYRGRVFALDTMLFTLATALSTFVQGNLIDSLGTDNVGIIAFGTGLLSFVPLALWLLAQRNWKDTPAEQLPRLERAQHVADA